jgi:hypothetical protein
VWLRDNSSVTTEALGRIEVTAKINRQSRPKAEPKDVDTKGQEAVTARGDGRGRQNKQSGCP